MTTYRVLTWDHEADDWSVEAAGLTRWEAGRKVRELEGCGWDRNLSILVERETN